MIMKGARETLTESCLESWHRAGEGRWLIAVSGGADSMALLLACVLAGIPSEAVHCNFNLRGDESIRDREFVKKICSDLDIPLQVAEFDTLRESEKGESIEMTCRRLRYDFFRGLKSEGHFRRIAIAHNADDNIETFFLNLLRGSGSKGLKGMSEDTGKIIRPLLHCTRNEIIGFLNRHRMQYIVDSTNLESDYRRNFLRNEIFPLLESRWKGFRKAVASTMRIQARENIIIERALDESLRGVGKVLPWVTIDNFADTETLIFYFIRQYGGSASIAEEMAHSVLRRKTGKRWKLDDSHFAVFTREGISVVDADAFGSVEEQVTGYEWERLENNPQLLQKIKTAPLSEIYLPYGEESYVWTTPSAEMRIKPIGMQGSQNVVKILKDAGIPAHCRVGFPILADKSTGEAIWLPGLKRSRRHLISSETKAVYHCFPRS